MGDPPRPYFRTNASRGLSATAEFLVLLSQRMPEAFDILPSRLVSLRDNVGGYCNHRRIGLSYNVGGRGHWSFKSSHQTVSVYTLRH